MILAYRISGDQGDAEDVVQEAFTRTWVKAPNWRPRVGAGQGSYGAWLARVVSNLAIDRLRRRRPHNPLDAAAELASDGLSPLDEMEGAQAHRRIMAALDTLPARQRTAIALCRLNGLSNAEAAVAMDVSVGALELLLVRARRALRTSLADLIEAHR